MVRRSGSLGLRVARKAPCRYIEGTTIWLPDMIPASFAFRRVHFALSALLLLAACSGPRRAAIPPASEPVPVPVAAETVSPLPIPPAPVADREFRGSWIATVDNIDWPSEPGLDAATQQNELLELLDQAAALRLNAIIFQVRPIADAVYESALEPFSWYVSGEQGRSPGWDPLAFAVEEAHRRGLELHAWFNPFRAGHPTMLGSYDSSHVSVSHPEWVLKYGTQMWIDPGVPEASAWSLSVIEDVVRRYDVDGVHLDDYFYPYPVNDTNGRNVPFPDTTSRRRAEARGTTLALGDWRRSNVDDFVHRLYQMVKRVKPWVKVGISPFGIWRPGHPEGVVGFDQYEQIYADARLWLREGWLDYFTPQLYWPVDSPGQPYGSLLKWWTGENLKQRHLWPGNFTSRVILEGTRHWEADEIVRQVRITRDQPGATGNVHFSMKALEPGPGADSLFALELYGEPALVPETGWLAGVSPGAPTAHLSSLADRHILHLLPGIGDGPFLWHVRVLRGEEWSVDIVPAWRHVIDLGVAAPTAVVVSAVNRLGQEGPDVYVTP